MTKSTASNLGGSDIQAAPAGRFRRRSRRVPLLRLLGYYLVLVALIGTLSWLFPLVRHAYLAPLDAPTVTGGDLFSTGRFPQPELPTAEPGLEHTLSRTAITLLVVLGALTLALPVAWVYMITKRLRYDASLVQSVIILPVVVAGILIVVKNSLAVAFSLAGIVAAVRFRNTLKDPKDAVYIFLALGMGISAGVQALDIALVVSLAFNLVVLGLWKFNVGAIYSGGQGPRGILTIGDRQLMVAQEADERQRILERVSEQEDAADADGLLVVHAGDPESGRHAVEASLSEMAKEWTLVGVEPGHRGCSTLEFLVTMKKKSSVVDLLGDLDDRWGTQVAAAEFISLRTGAIENEPEDDS